MINSTPLRTVHFGRAHSISSQTCVDINFSLAGKCKSSGASIGCDQGVADGQLNPLTCTCAVEFRNIQLAFIQVLIAGSHTATNVSSIPVSSSYKLVDVLIAAVAAHVEGQWLAHHRNATHSGLVRKTSHGCALGRASCWVQRIQL